MDVSLSFKELQGNRLQMSLSLEINEQYKVRLVAKRYAQKEGIDYNEILSLIVKHTSIQMLLAIVERGFHTTQCQIYKVEFFLGMNRGLSKSN